MESLVSATSFDLALRILAIVGPVMGFTIWLVYRTKSSGDKGIIWSVSVGVVPVLIYALWCIELVSIRVFGLDSILGLGIMVVIFCAAGVASAALITTLSRRGK